MQGLLDGVFRTHHDWVRLEVGPELSRTRDEGEGQSLDFRVSSLGVEERLANVVNRPLYLVFFAYKNCAHDLIKNREVDIQGLAILRFREERGELK